MRISQISVLFFDTATCSAVQPWPHRWFTVAPYERRSPTMSTFSSSHAGGDKQSILNSLAVVYHCLPFVHKWLWKMYLCIKGFLCSCCWCRGQPRPPEGCAHMTSAHKTQQAAGLSVLVTCVCQQCQDGLEWKQTNKQPCWQRFECAALSLHPNSYQTCNMGNVQILWVCVCGGGGVI